MPRLVTGMVAANQPFRTIPRLSRALSAALAAGAFGVFCSSIWQMASYLSVTRLVSIGLLAVLAMTVWLILGNRLWDSPSAPAGRRITALYNLSTVVTITVTILLLYAALFLLILVTSLAVIDLEYMRTVVGHEAGLTNFVRLSSLSATRGIVGGGLGAGFDSDAAIRTLTHGQRERQRRRRTDTEATLA